LVNPEYRSAVRTITVLLDTPRSRLQGVFLGEPAKTGFRVPRSGA